MTDVITGSGSYITVDGRRVEIRDEGPDFSIVTATNLGIMSRVDNTRRKTAQVYYRNGDVVLPRPGEENDRIVGHWHGPIPKSPVQEVTTKKLVAGTYGLVTLYKVDDSWRTEFVKSNGTPEELRAAAQTLIEIADFIDAS